MGQPNVMYSLDFKVRDYECDLQGIVNNANYQHYYEHTRHEWLSLYQISFKELHNVGKDFVVARLEMAYKNPLRAEDSFRCTLNFKQDGVKYMFYQRIYRLPDLLLCNTATFTTVVLDNGVLARCSELDILANNLLASSPSK